MLLANVLFIVSLFLLWILWPTRTTAHRVTDMVDVPQQDVETARWKFLNDMDALLAVDVRIPNNIDEDKVGFVFQQDVYLIGREIETIGNPCTATIASHRHRRNTRALYIDFPMENLLESRILHATLHVHQSWLTTSTFLTALFCEHSSNLGSLSMRNLTVTNHWASADIGDWLQSFAYIPTRVVLKIMQNGTLNFQQRSQLPYLFVEVGSVEREKRRVGLCEPGMHRHECCLEPLEYDFQARGYHQVVEPRKVTVHHCEGTCSPATHTRKHLDAYEALVHFMKDPSRLVDGDKCCKPSKFKALHLFIRNSSGETVMKTLENVDAADCHCLY